MIKPAQFTMLSGSSLQALKTFHALNALVKQISLFHRFTCPCEFWFEPKLAQFKNNVDLLEVSSVYEPKTCAVKLCGSIGYNHLQLASAF